MVIFGNRLFGKVDQVPGLGYVATRFFHIDYVPLIPYEGWLVLRHEGKSWRGIKIPISPKSLLTAWARIAAFLAGLIAGIAALVQFNGGRSDAAEAPLLLLLSIVGWAALIFLMKHKSITRASYARACALGRLAKLSEKGMAAIAAAYGEAPPTYGFQPINARKAATRQSVPVMPIEDDFNEIPPGEVEQIPVEEPDSDEVPSGIAAVPTPPARPRTETRRHG